MRATGHRCACTHTHQDTAADLQITSSTTFVGCGHVCVSFNAGAAFAFFPVSSVDHDRHDVDDVPLEGTQARHVFSGAWHAFRATVVMAALTAAALVHLSIPGPRQTNQEMLRKLAAVFFLRL